MEYIIVVFVSLFSSVIGSICGIGGGVIIKPVLDAAGVIPVNTISFLSGCTVLSMSVVSVIQNQRNQNRQILDKRIATLLAAGAVVGGILGKALYQRVLNGLSDSQRVGAVQAVVLLSVTAGTLIYTVNKSRVKALDVTGSALCAAIGCVLGMMSAFLGIGGGPVNLVVLFYFFSMGTKQAAAYSLYIIMFSQAASLISSLVTGQVPEFSLLMLVLMAAGGVAGGFAGSKVNQQIREQHVEWLFLGLMAVIILINIFNIIKYI